MNYLALPERFQEKISPEPNTGCWLWLGAPGGDGYGRISVKNRDTLAHRAVFAILIREPSGTLTIDHLCRNRICVNPRHMEEVTRAENVLRGVSPNAQNARKTHCKRGHPLSGENLGINIYCPRRTRYCISCRKALKRDYDKNRYERTHR